MRIRKLVSNDKTSREGCLVFLLSFRCNSSVYKLLQLSEAEVVLRPITRATEETEDKGLD